MVEISRRNESVIDAVIEAKTSTNRPYLIEMLRYIHDPAVADTIILTIFYQGETSEEARRERFQRIDKMEFAAHLLSLLSTPDSTETVSGKIIFNA